MQADSQHTHEFSVCIAVPTQMLGCQPPEPSFWSFQRVSFQQELTLHPQSVVYNGHHPTRGFWVHFERQEFV